MKIKAYFLYLGYLGWLAVLFVVLFLGLNNTGLGITLAFLTFILSPGVLLLRIIKPLTSSFMGRLVLIIGLGFGFYFLLSLIAILLNLAISQLVIISALLIGILFILAFFKDFRNIWQPDWQWFKNQTIGDWLLIVAVLIGIIIAFLAVDAQSDKIGGDGWFHLAILQKVASGYSLDSHNLWMTKTTALNPVYSFPIWHILVGLFSKIINVPAFTVWRQVMLPVTLIAMIVWLGFFKTFFKNTSLIVLCFLCFLVYLLIANSFYMFSAIITPDTLCRLLLLPLVLLLTAQYLFEEKANKLFYCLLISLLAIFTGLVHFTQLIDYFLILIVFAILLLIFVRQKQIIQKLGWLFLALIGLIVPYLFIFQGGNISQIILGNINTFILQEGRININVFYFYPLLMLPILFLFIKKEHRLVFLISVPLTLLLAAWEESPLSNFFQKYLGEIFIKRAISDIPHWIFWGFGLYLILIGLNIIFLKTKIIKILNIVLGLLFVAILVFSPLRDIFNYLVAEVLFNSKNDINYFLGSNLWLIFGAVSVVVIAICIWKKYPSWTIPEPKDKLNFSILTIILIGILSLPYISGFKEVRAKNPNGNLLTNRKMIFKSYASDISRLGGQQTLDFWNSVPWKSVFLTDNVTLAQMVLLYSPNYVAEYPYAIKEFTTSKIFYDDSISLTKRLSVLDNLEVDYIIVRHLEETSFLEEHPQYFRLSFSNLFSFKGANKEIYIYQYLK